MHFAVGTGHIAWNVNISEARLKMLQNCNDRDKAIAAAMTTWQTIANFFSDGSHEEAFGYLFDALQANKKYLDTNSTESERTAYKKQAMDSLDSLRNLARAEHQEIFDPQYDGNTGQFFYDFYYSGDVSVADIPLNPDRERYIADSGSTAGNLLVFETFENAQVKSCWMCMRDHFNSNSKVKALNLLHEAYEATNLKDRISSFKKLSELAKPDSRHLFKIKIEDAFCHPAKIACSFNETDLFQDACLNGEDYAECLLACPETLISDEQPSGNAARMLFCLGKLSQQKFDAIFSQPNRTAALGIINDLCHKNDNVNHVNLHALIKLGDPRQMEPLLSAFSSDGETASIPATMRRLNGCLNQVPTQTGEEGSHSISAKARLIEDLDVVFGPASKYSPGMQALIRNCLEENINNDQNMNSRKTKQLILDAYFGIKS